MKDGYFWCSVCEAEYPDAIQKVHESSHGTQPPFSDYTVTDAIFWALCFAIGVIGGLLFASLS